MSNSIEWIGVKDPMEPSRLIGAIGFIDENAVVVVALFDDNDADKDGKVSWKEKIVSTISPISLKGQAVAEVAMAARMDPQVMLKDTSFSQMSGSIFTNFAAGMAMDGIYAAYFARGVSVIAGGAAGRITQSAIKGFVIRKGFEATAKKAFGKAVGR